MEIERKWMVNGWPSGLPLVNEYAMRQGYLTTRPTVRIREEKKAGHAAQYILCIKSSGTIAREEMEISISYEQFSKLENIIGLPLIPKIRRTYRLPDGMLLEVNHVDSGQPTEFWYAEIEYTSVEEARAWKPSTREMTQYLQDDVTDQPGQSMGAYWETTRCHGNSSAKEKFNR